MIPIVIQYTPYAEGIKIIGVDGRAARLRLPDTIDGLPVVAVGPYAFAVTAEAPVSQNRTQAAYTFLQIEDRTRKEAVEASTGEAVQQVELPDTVREIDAYAFAGCTALTAVRLPVGIKKLADHLFAGCVLLETLHLPPDLEEIGEYAFYDCRSIKRLRLPETVKSIGKYACYNCRSMEEINIPRGAVQLGTGLFLNCDRLQYLIFGRCRHIADLVAVLNHELHLTIDFEDGQRAKLLIPDFQYEYIEDTPARQFHQVNYGTGHLFRQCIGNSDIDFRRYDELFYLTKREDGTLLVLLLTMYRLEYPYRLQENRRQAYLEYLQEHFLTAFAYYTAKNDLETIRLFAQWGLITAENIQQLLEMTGAQRKTECTGFLLEYQHVHIGTKRKSFEL
ncbi:MAG TPA: leucine-rich repeat domain-containing protein [Candidatus Anaerotignum merdipullorum]|nr:leucine-rich repeat domain-containing protein [Candidatus Anaerotignum merdipullorum]